MHSCVPRGALASATGSCGPQVRPQTLDALWNLNSLQTQEDGERTTLLGNEALRNCPLPFPGPGVDEICLSGRKLRQSQLEYLIA